MQRFPYRLGTGKRHLFTMNLSTATTGNEAMTSSLLFTTEMTFGNYSSINDTDASRNETVTPLPVKPGEYEMLMGLLLFRLAIDINKHYPVVLYGVGVPGNVAALVTICNMRPLTSSYVYMAALAVVDILSLNVKLTYIGLQSNNMFVTDFGCKILMFLTSFCMHFSNWILVAMTIERLIAIWFPLKVANWSTKRRAFIVLALMGLALSLINIHRMIMWIEVKRWAGSMCVHHPDYTHFNVNILPYLHATVYSFIPVIILVPCNIMIIVSLKRSSKKLLKLTNKVNKEQAMEKEKQQNQITVMLVSVSIVFVVLTLPYVIFFLIAIYWDFRYNYSGVAIYFFLEQVAYLSAESNHAVNFFLYFLTGKKFRDSFFRLLCCVCRMMGKDEKAQASTSQSKYNAPNTKNVSNQVQTEQSIIDSTHFDKY